MEIFIIRQKIVSIVDSLGQAGWQAVRMLAGMCAMDAVHGTRNWRSSSTSSGPVCGVRYADVRTIGFRVRFDPPIRSRLFCYERRHLYMCDKTSRATKTEQSYVVRTVQLLINSGLAAPSHEMVYTSLPRPSWWTAACTVGPRNPALFFVACEVLSLTNNVNTLLDRDGFRHATHVRPNRSPAKSRSHRLENVLHQRNIFCFVRVCLWVHLVFSTSSSGLGKAKFSRISIQVIDAKRRLTALSCHVAKFVASFCTLLSENFFCV